MTARRSRSEFIVWRIYSYPYESCLQIHAWKFMLKVTASEDFMCPLSCRRPADPPRDICCCSYSSPSPLFPYPTSFWSAFLFPSIILTAAWCQAAGIYSVICVCLRGSSGGVHVCMCSVRVCGLLPACQTVHMGCRLPVCVRTEEI